jgi:pyruvate dehydrogenase E2 component (dihydrolipoamide acetyltransferase)
METDKALVDIPSPYQGTITKLHGNVDDIIKTDAPFIVFELEKNDSTSYSSETVVGSVNHSEKQVDFTKVHNEDNSNQKLTPQAWSLLESYQLDFSFVAEHFKESEVVSAEVLQNKIALLGLTKHRAKSIGEGFNSIRNAMFNTISKANEQVAPVSLFDTANISKWRAGEDLTVRVIKAIEKAIAETPMINSHYHDNSHHLEIMPEVNCGIAMDSEHGLYVPVLHDVAKQNSKEIRNKINHYKQQVKQKALRKESTDNPTILLSNFGVFGAKHATPMVIPPMVAIVGLGKSHKQVLVTENDEASIASVLPISLTVDHRIITGGEATRFLASLITYLECESI